MCKHALNKFPSCMSVKRPFGIETFQGETFRYKNRLEQLPFGISICRQPQNLLLNFELLILIAISVSEFQDFGLGRPVLFSD